MEILTPNAVLFMSSGFDDPYVLQIYAIRRRTDAQKVYHLCLTDGAIHIGARFSTSEPLDLENYWVVKITADFVDKSQPIIIKTLSVVSTAHTKLLGSPPLSLNQYFQKETEKNYQQGHPRKKIKMNTQDSGHKKGGYQHKFNNLNREENNLLSKRAASGKNQKRLRIANQSDSSQNGPKPSSQQEGTRIKQDNNSNHSSIPVQPTSPKKLVQNTVIRDLFARSNNWVILCRVDHLNFVECKKGYAVNFALSDQNGDYIKCVYFDSSKERAKETIQVRKYYLFSQGEVKTQRQQLKITFDQTSEIQQVKDQSFQINEKRFTRIDHVEEFRHEEEISVIGVVKRIKNKEQLSTRKMKITGTLCDPVYLIEIDFMIYIPIGDPEIQTGHVVIMNKFHIYNQNNIFRLNSQFGSYFTEVQSVNPLAAEFLKIMNNKDWMNESYRNLSMFAFTHRNFSELKDIVSRTQDQKIFSAIDCWILEISKKKSYNACKICKRITQKKQMNLFHCSACRRTVDTVLTYTLSVNFTDFTGNCLVDVIGQHAENLIDLKANEYISLSLQQQGDHLQNLKYKNVILKLRTERKEEKRCIQSVYGIEKPNTQFTLKEIRKRLNLNRMKIENNW